MYREKECDNLGDAVIQIMDSDQGICSAVGFSPVETYHVSTAVRERVCGLQCIPLAGLSLGATESEAEAVS